MQMIDFEFRNDLIKEVFSLSYCYQCETCFSTCPVALVTNGEYNPRKINKNIGDDVFWVKM